MDREAFAFFREHAGSYRPGRETEAQGKARGAQALAYAEARARALGAVFAWQHCPDADSSDFTDEEPPRSLWDCLCYGSSGRVLASLSAIDFGRDGSPYSDSYARVVAAELALDAFPSELSRQRNETGPCTPSTPKNSVSLY